MLNRFRGATSVQRGREAVNVFLGNRVRAVRGFCSTFGVALVPVRMSCSSSASRTAAAGCVAHEAEQQAHALDSSRARQRRLFSHLRFALADILQETLGLDRQSDGDDCGGGDGPAAEGRPKGARHRSDPRSPACRERRRREYRHRALSRSSGYRAPCRAPARRKMPTPTDTGLDFVGNQQRIMPRRFLPQGSR